MRAQSSSRRRPGVPAAKRRESRRPGSDSRRQPVSPSAAGSPGGPRDAAGCVVASCAAPFGFNRVVRDSVRRWGSQHGNQSRECVVRTSIPDVGCGNVPAGSRKAQAIVRRPPTRVRTPLVGSSEFGRKHRFAASLRPDCPQLRTIDTTLDKSQNGRDVRFAAFAHNR